MRVLVLTQGFPRHEADHHATFVLDHARALAAAGLEVTVVCPSGPGLAARERFGDIEVVRFRYAPRRFETLAYTGAMHRRAQGPAALLVLPFLLGFLVAALREAPRVQVVHGHWWVPSGAIAVACGRLLGRVSVVQLHGTDRALARGPLRWLAGVTLRRATSVVAVSDSLGHWCREVSGRDAAVIPMPLALGRLPEPTPAPSTGPLLAIGRLVPEKGFDLLIRAAAQTGDRVVIAGDGPMRGDLERSAEEVGADVELLGAVPPGEIGDLYRSARLVVVPSRREGFGLVAAEAAATGRAVVASDTGGLPDVVRPGLNGTLVPPGDVAALAAAISSTPAELGLAGPDVVRDLRPEIVATRTLALYDVDPPPPSGERLLRRTGAAFAAVAVLLLLLSVRRHWDDAGSLDLEWRPGLVAAATALVVGAGFVLSWSWGWLVRAMGEDLPVGAGLRLWWSGQLGRYLPTGLGSVPARVVLAVRSGVTRQAAVRSTAAEPLVAVVACAAGAALLGSVVLFVVAAAAAAAMVTAAAPLLRTRRTVVAGFFGLQLGQVLLRAGALWMLLGLFGTHPSLRVAAGAACMGYTLGLLAVFAPGGVGVREAAMAGALGAAVGAPAAFGAALVLRLLEVLVELVFLAGTRLIPLHRKSGCQPQPST